LNRQRFFFVPTTLLFAGAFAILGSFPSQAIELNLPEGAQLAVNDIAPQTRFALPTGPAVNGAVPTRLIDGTVSTQIWHVPEIGETPRQIIDSVTRQVAGLGYDPVFDCDARQCGGFEFRFGIDLAPAPDMLVDLSNYHQASFSNGTDRALSVFASKAGSRGFIQIVHVLPEGETPLPAVQSTRAPAASGLLSSEMEIGAKLAESGATVLDDLEFASGAADLTDTEFASLTALSDWLKATPTAHVALVGHTDAEGTLANNIALSKRRANAVLRRVIGTYGVDPAQITADGVGFLAPRATNTTEEGRRFNRRVEVVLLPD